MRILYFSRDYTTHDHRFLTALARSEHEIFYLRLEQRGQALEDRALPLEIEQVHWRGGQGPASLNDGPALLADLRRVIRRLKPNLIQAGPLQRCALLVALTGFRPLVSMSWGYDLLIDAPRNSLWRWATRYTLQHSAALVGDCDTIRKLAISYGMPDERIVTFPWGIDIEHFHPQPAPQSEIRDQHSATPFTLLSTRNWEPIYGVDTIARAFVLAARQRPELRLVMLGNGSQASLLHRILGNSSTRSSVSTLERPDDAALAGNNDDRSAHVLLPGLVNYNELPRFYRSADLYVAATHSDGTSISLLEAMASGRPVLVSDIPGNREWVEPGKNGWLFPEGDAEALAQAIIQAVDARQRLTEMGRAARQVAEDRADWNKNFPKLYQAFEIALKDLKPESAIASTGCIKPNK